MVDDSAADRKLCRILLEGRYGQKLEFVEAATSAAGLEACRSTLKPNGGPSCLLLDYKLPDMNGLEFLEKLKDKIDQTPRTFPVVMLTALGSEGIAAAAIKAGVQDYLVKDQITAESLNHAVEKALERVSLIQALKAERDELERSVAEKDVLLREVHHRVKNNLQVVSSLLRLQAEGLRAAGELNDRLARAFHDSQNRVESMALIHELLYATPGSDQGDLREVDLASFASVLAGNLTHAYGVDPQRIHCRVQVEPSLREPVDRAIPAGLILNELLSNALQHAFPDNRQGTLWIEGRGSNGLVKLEVGDDGIGMPARVGAAHPRSFGLEIVRILTRQLHGVFELDGTKGTICRITFPET